LWWALNKEVYVLSSMELWYPDDIHFLSVLSFLIRSQNHGLSNGNCANKCLPTVISYFNVHSKAESVELFLKKKKNSVAGNIYGKGKF